MSFQLGILLEWDVLWGSVPAHPFLLVPVRFPARCFVPPASIRGLVSVLILFLRYGHESWPDEGLVFGVESSQVVLL